MTTLSLDVDQPSYLLLPLRAAEEATPAPGAATPEPVPEPVTDLPATGAGLGLVGLLLLVFGSLSRCRRA